MYFFAICGGLLLALALFIRAYHLSRERAARMAAFEHLHASLETTTRQLRRTREDLYVLRAALHERGALSEEEFVRCRARLIDKPRRRAEERVEILRELEIPPRQLVADDTDSVH